MPALGAGARGGPQHIPRPAGARPGVPAPWGDLSSEQRRFTVSDIRAALDASGPPTTQRPGMAPPSAAVLAPIYEHDGDTWVVLTRRAWTLRSHTGEVSFPGGRCENGEPLWVTATRESEEEIGLPPELVVQIGELDHLSTVSSRSAIVPYVATLPAGRPELVASKAEVDAILHVPIAELLDPDVYHREVWSFAGAERDIHFFELVGDTVWGATGSMLVDLLTRITGTRERAGRIR